MVDDLPDMAVGVGKESIKPAQRGGSGPLDYDPAGSGRLVEQGVDLGVGGHVNRQDGSPVGWPARAAATSWPPSSANSSSVQTSSILPAVLNRDMAAVEADDSFQPSATKNAVDRARSVDRRRRR